MINKFNNFTLFAFIMLSACTTNHGTFTILSNRNVDLAELKNNSEKITEVEGKDMNQIIFFIPLKTNTDLSTAVNDALERSGGDAMVNTHVKYISWYVPYIYGRQGWVIKGDVLKIKNK